MGSNMVILHSNTPLQAQLASGGHNGMHNTMVQLKDVRGQVLGSSVSRVDLAINLVACEGSRGNVVPCIVHSSLDVPGSLGVLDVFPNDEGTFRITEKWNG